MKHLIEFNKYLITENKKYEHINFIPYKIMSSRAKRGLKYVKEHNLKISPTILSVAKKIAKRDKISPILINKMTAFFKRYKHIKNTNKKEPWKDIKYVKFILMGGDTGRVWSERIRTQIVKADNKNKKKK